MSQEILSNFQVQKGDRIELNYTILSLWEQSQVASIIGQINQDSRMNVLDYNLETNNWYSDRLKVTIEVLENPFPLLVLILAIAAVAGAIFVYLSFDKAYLISREIGTTGVTAIAAIPWAIFGILGLGVYIVLRK